MVSFGSEQSQTLTQITNDITMSYPNIWSEFFSLGIVKSQKIQTQISCLTSDLNHLNLLNPPKKCLKPSAKSFSPNFGFLKYPKASRLYYNSWFEISVLHLQTCHLFFLPSRCRNDNRYPWTSVYCWVKDLKCIHTQICS